MGPGILSVPPERESRVRKCRQTIVADMVKFDDINVLSGHEGLKKKLLFVKNKHQTCFSLSRVCTHQ